MTNEPLKAFRHKKTGEWMMITSKGFIVSPVPEYWLEKYAKSFLADFDKDGEIEHVEVIIMTADELKAKIQEAFMDGQKNIRDRFGIEG